MKTTHFHIVLGICVLVFLGATDLYAQRVSRPGPGIAGTWQVIGTTQAGFSTDHDVIHVQGPFDNFRKIKFKVTDAPLNLDRLVVTYDNGKRDRIPVRENIRQGGESRVIDLKGGKRSIRKIEFWYDTKGIFRGKADVTVYGRK